MAASNQHLRPPHPRRPTAQCSVSLRHHTGPSTSSNSRSTQQSSSEGSPSSTKPLVSKADSGESSNADRWFESSNNNASGSRGPVDNDPPFFLQHSSSEETPIEGAPGPSPPLMGNYTVPLHIALHHAGTEGSSSSDFRAVIDDLTVENKKLRRRLKKYEKLQDAHLKDEKLFEVRVHGLPSGKKRELEDLLRKFALSTTDLPVASESASGNPYERAVPALNTHKTASSSSNFADSAYASASASASASGQGSALSNNSSQTRPQFRRSARSSNNNIHSYLHDIPEGLLPQNPAAMTEKAKKKLVVRRLEQIFAGTGAEKGEHHHPLQQQEVSQLAAKADRSALEATGQFPALEGSREARIMMEEAEEAISKRSPSANTEITQGIEPEQKVLEHDFAADSPEQRPTRPLDLDPYRAQNPIDNIQYIRHLGFSPPDASMLRKYEEGHGWIYLNFLVNMAQLHTLNVTADFVKKALTESSSQFELSHDGRKVRWKGGRSVTRTSSEADESSPFNTSRSPNSKSPKKRVKSSHHAGNGRGRHMKQRLMERQDNKLVYTPLFFHRSSDDSSDNSSSDEEEIESPFLPLMGGDSSGMTSSGVRTVSAKRMKKREDGPIIFYSNSRFCTDLSGDNKTEVAMMYNPIMYHVATKQPIGITSPPEANQQDTLEPRGPLHTAEELPEAMDLDDNPIPESLEINFPGQTPLSQASSSSKSPMNMQVSGIGGICPADNFSINVKTQLVPTGKAGTQSTQRKTSKYCKHIANVLKDKDQGNGPHLLFEEDVLQTSRQQLPPSELPPASMFMDVEESDYDDSDAESCQSFSPDMGSNHDVPSAAPQAIDMPYLSSDESNDEHSDDDDDDDDGDAESEGSLDLLATAREIDPETVRAREREYDANMAERLAEEIPAGSSAATAGGGSGFASPASGVDIKEYNAARAQYRRQTSGEDSAPPSFNRAQTSDSMVVNGKSP